MIARKHTFFFSMAFLLTAMNISADQDEKIQNRTNSFYEQMQKDLREIDEKIREEKEQPKEEKKEMKLKWKKVEYVKKYSIGIYQKNRELIKEIETEKTIHTEMLRPGEYLIRLRSIDRFNRQGPWSDYIKITLSNSKDSFYLNQLYKEKEKREEEYSYIIEEREKLQRSREKRSFCRHFQVSNSIGTIYEDLDLDFKQKFAWNINASCDMHTYIPWVAGMNTGIWSMRNDFQDNLFLFRATPYVALVYDYYPFRFMAPVGYGYSRVEVFYNYFEYDDDMPYFFTGLILEYYLNNSISLTGFIEYSIVYGEESNDEFWLPYIGVEYRFY